MTETAEATRTIVIDETYDDEARQALATKLNGQPANDALAAASDGAPNGLVLIDQDGDPVAEGSWHGIVVTGWVH